METRKRLSLFVCTIMALVVTAGCGGSSVSSGSSGEEESTAAGSSDGEGMLTVFAASSLTDAFGELGESFTRETGAEVTFNFTSSSTLATQITQGAPADVYASADEAQMDNVVNEDLVSGAPEVFACNREVVIVPKDNPGDIQDFADLANPDLRLVLALDEVPAAEYAMEILGNAADDPEYGPEFEQSVLDNIVSREEDVRASVNRVVTGDADATFSYASDVTPDIRDEVEVIEIPENLQIVAEYPIAVLSDAQDPDLAQQWVDLVTSDEGQQTLEEWGFETAN